MQARAKYLPRHPSERGFTLIELMTVVVIVGVLAMIGLVAYRKFILSSKTSEAIYMVGAIRSAEESYRAETLGYLDVTASFSVYYPSASPGAFKTGWGDTSTDDGKRWAQLGARPDGAVYYGYKVGAGIAGGAIPTMAEVGSPPWPTPTGPWYVIMAKGDVDGNGVYSYVAGSSFTGEIYIQNEGE